MRILEIFFQAPERPWRILAETENIFADRCRLLSETVWLGEEVGVDEPEEMSELVFISMMRCGSEQVLSSPRIREIVAGFKEYRLVHDHCKRCQGSHSLISWLFKPLASIAGIKTMKPFFYKHTRLFD